MTHSLDVFSDHGGQFPWNSRLIDVGDGKRQALVDEGPGDARSRFSACTATPLWASSIARSSAICRETAAFSSLITSALVEATSHMISDTSRSSATSANLTRTLDEVGARNVVLVIQDWGGPVGMGWAVHHPNRVASVVVLKHRRLNNEIPTYTQ